MKRSALCLFLVVPVILSVMAGSMATSTLPLVAGTPLLPPFGLLILLAWRLMRPGMWPAWIGLPLGLFDDLYNGQPFGSSAFIWSLCMIAVELVDRVGKADPEQRVVARRVGVVVHVADLGRQRPGEQQGDGQRRGRGDRRADGLGRFPLAHWRTSVRQALLVLPRS